MAGKAYTMREMREVVQYLTERKAYSEIKGRKMWMEYANSEKTKRTWKSLKETFLKCILPDIQNPYYKLSMNQIRSFNQGYDVAEKEKNNRLVVRTASEDSMGDSHNKNEQSTTKKDNEPPATSQDNETQNTNIDEELEITDETISSAKIPQLTEEQFSALLKTKPENAVVSGTSTEKEVSINQDKNIEIVEFKNLCLQSVNLYEEQFNNTKYSDSDYYDEAAPVLKQNKKEANPQTNTNLSILLQGDSQNENEQSTTKKYNKPPATSQDNEAQTTNIDEVLEKTTGETITSAKISQLTEEQFNALLKTEPENAVVSGTSTEKEVSINQDENIEIVEFKNLCLQSVNLYEEQFNDTKYSDSDYDDEATPVLNQNKNEAHSQTDTDGKKETEGKPQKKVNINKETGVKIVENIAGCEQQKQGTVNNIDNVVNKSVNLQRERALSNEFGFTHGFGASTTRKRQSSYRRRSDHHQRHSKSNDSNSSEWTSESDSECYVSPPCGRRNRQTNFFLKPKSSRILQDSVEGMLYVAFGNNIYPLVKDGKHINNFLTYRSDSASDDEESYWRQKYLEEKMRVEELKKLLEESRKNEAPVVDAPTSPILPSKSRDNSSTQFQQKPAQKENSKATPPVENKSETGDTKLVLKIATQNGLEYCLEGEWSQISNVMPQMVKMLQSETDTISLTTAENKEPSRKRKAVEQKPSKIYEDMEVSSVASTSDTAILAIDTEVHEKVNEIEMKILKEIKEREKEEQVKQHEAESINVTQRKPTTPRKDSSSSSITTSQSLAKKARISKTSSTESEQEMTKSTKTKRVSTPKLDIPKEQQEHKEEQKETDQQSKTTTGQQTKAKEQQSMTKEQQTITTEQLTKVSQHQTEQNGSDPTVGTITVDKEQNPIINQKQPKRRKSLRLSKQKKTDDHNSSKGSFEGRSSTRMVKTPKKYDTASSASDTVLRSGKSTSKVTTALNPSPKSNKTSPRKIRSLPKTNLVPLQENTSGNSIDSTQGYQDSDASPIKIVLKKKKKISFGTKNKYKNRRIIRRNSYPTLLQELSSDSNSSSYFVPTRKSQPSTALPKEKSIFNKLERIDENSPTQKFDTTIRHFNNISKDSDKLTNENSNIRKDIDGSSSIVSLPLSPELSVVENFSISNDLIRSENHPTIKVQSNVSSLAMDFIEYNMISNVDISAPLMDQQNELRISTDTLTRKNNATLSETLDQRLRDLLLESSKKTTRVDNNNENALEINQTEITTVKKSKTRGQKKSAMEGNESKSTTTKKTGPHKRKENAMEVDESKNVTAKKTRAKKRSSTPQKKKTTEIQKVAKDRVTVEEHMEYCSSAGRKSCPPVIIHLPVNENTNNCTDVTLNPVKLNTRKKQDVIKVKIQRQRDNSRSRERLRKTFVENVSVMSNNTDNGINDTGATSGLFLKDNEDSVDLIHNHSETSLLANECMGDSVEFVEDSVSIISLSCCKQSMYSELERLLDEAAKLSRETLVDSRNNSSFEQKTSEEILESPETVYHTPVAANSSLLVEDLSVDPPQQIEWCYHSDDNTNAPSVSNSNMAIFGSSL